jgi:hypothetical protein
MMSFNPFGIFATIITTIQFVTEVIAHPDRACYGHHWLLHNAEALSKLLDESIIERGIRLRGDTPRLPGTASQPGIASAQQLSLYQPTLCPSETFHCFCGRVDRSLSLVSDHIFQAGLAPKAKDLLVGIDVVGRSSFCSEIGLFGKCNRFFILKPA